ncbi:LOW QUALITY PROTEIN: phosphate transport ATP-binding protein PstB [Geomicrobium sp. JCM 19037]|nr:LOW QUALITY PROTEIN: phosphate transport ATP-binding protein PstB [Geomicrobium sp. JCM 19037]
MHEARVNSATPQAETVYQIEDLRVAYGDNEVLHGVSLPIRKNQVTALIGPSGCGKSTLLKTLNLMIYADEHVHMSGTISFEGENILREKQDPVDLRKRVGMVFQKPSPFRKSIFDNVSYGPKVHGVKKKDLAEIVERSLKDAYLFDEVKDRLHDSAFSLSGGQQQRLCIARALATSPEVILMDEPTSALDPKATLAVEDLISKLKEKYTVVLVTHQMEQAARVSNSTAFLYMGNVVEHGETHRLFSNPLRKQTEDYITGRFG